MLKTHQVDIFFTEAGDKALCLICREVIAAFKEHNLKCYLSTKYPGYCSELSQEARAEKSDQMVEQLK